MPDNDTILNLVRPMVRNIAPYRSARDEFEDFQAKKIFLDANENPFEGIANRYPDPLQRQLNRVLAKVKGLAPDQILLGNGSDEVLDLIFRTFCEPGTDEVILLPPTYGMYAVLAKLNNIIAKTVALTSDFELDLKAIFKSVNPNTKIIFVCSPNNPTANAIPIQQIQTLLDQFSGLVVVDEAYIDFSSKPSAVGLLHDYPRLIVCQTFSKAYGLAGIRLGMGFANPTIINFFNKIKPPYNINSLSQKIALEVLEDPSAVRRQVQQIIAERKRMEDALLTCKFVQSIFPSDANFLLIRVDDAEKRYHQLIEAGIVVRNRSSLFGCENTLRITIGTPQENEVFINACRTIDQ